jgi:hypothetical protein
MSLAVAAQAEILRLKLVQKVGIPIVDAFDSLVSHASSDDSAQVPLSHQQLRYPSGHHTPMNGYYRVSKSSFSLYYFCSILKNNPTLKTHTHSIWFFIYYLFETANRDDRAWLPSPIVPREPGFVFR